MDELALVPRQAARAVVDYFLDQIADGDERPREVVLALCAIRWPNKRFEVRCDGDGLVTTKHVFDADTGEDADQLLKRWQVERLYA